MSFRFLVVHFIFFNEEIAIAIAIAITRTQFADRGFYIAGPLVWNSLSLDLRRIDSVFVFKSRIKTNFYRQAFVVR